MNGQIAELLIRGRGGAGLTEAFKFATVRDNDTAGVDIAFDTTKMHEKTARTFCAVIENAFAAVGSTPELIVESGSAYLRFNDEYDVAIIRTLGIGPG